MLVACANGAFLLEKSSSVSIVHKLYCRLDLKKC